MYLEKGSYGFWYQCPRPAVILPTRNIVYDCLINRINGAKSANLTLIDSNGTSKA